MKCPKCSVFSEDFSKFCPNCGIDLSSGFVICDPIVGASESGVINDGVNVESESSVRVCSICGNNNAIDDEFCSFCGVFLDQKEISIKDPKLMQDKGVKIYIKWLVLTYIISPLCAILSFLGVFGENSLGLLFILLYFYGRFKLWIVYRENKMVKVFRLKIRLMFLFFKIIALIFLCVLAFILTQR